jgi:putative membrane protein
MNKAEQFLCRVAFGLLFCGLLLSVTLTTGGRKFAARDTARTQSAKAIVPGLNPADAQFLKQASQGAIVQIELGKLALQKAGSLEVRNFGQRMVLDHTALGSQLQRIATDRGIAVQVDTDNAVRSIRDRLEKLSPDEFDKAYIATVVRNQRSDLVEFRKARKVAGDSDVKQFATSALPTLEEHIKEARAALADNLASVNPKGTVGRSRASSHI